MKTLNEILSEEIEPLSGDSFNIGESISRIKIEIEKLVHKSHGWTDFKKNLDKFCGEE